MTFSVIASSKLPNLLKNESINKKTSIKENLVKMMF